LVSEAPPPELDFAALIADMKLAGFDGGARAGANLDFEALAGGQEEILRRAVADPAEAQLDIARAAFKVALANLRALRQPG
jgi:hypothetical protein